MTSPRRIAVVLIAAVYTLATSVAAIAEQVTVTINQTTSPGTSVFVSSDLPVMGAGSVSRSVKLSPHDYPVWSATFDLPAGTTFTPRFYLRSDAPADAGSSSGTLASTGAPQFTGPDATLRVPVLSVYTAATVSTVTAAITSPVDATTVDTISFTPVDVPGGRVFSAPIPLAHHAAGRLYRINAGGTLLPNDGPVRVPGVDIWWRHGQAFQYDPDSITSTPASQRRADFAFTPPAATAFKARTIRVLLPRGYDASTRAYPVLYAQDGQNVFSPGGAFGSWDLDLIVSNLIARGEIPEIIVVGIDNTSDRLVEYTPEYASISGNQGRGGPFLTMLRDNLLPNVNSRFRTLTGPADTVHLGSSLGGILGFQAADEYNATFGTVIAMSPSFWVDTTDFLARALQPPAGFASLYLDSGNTGDSSSDGYWNTINVRDRRIEAGESFGSRFMHVVGAGDSHNEAAWRRRSPDALRWAYSGRLAPVQAASAPTGMILY